MRVIQNLIKECLTETLFRNGKLKSQNLPSKPFFPLSFRYSTESKHYTWLVQYSNNKHCDFFVCLFVSVISRKTGRLKLTGPNLTSEWHKKPSVCFHVKEKLTQEELVQVKWAWAESWSKILPLLLLSNPAKEPLKAPCKTHCTWVDQGQLQNTRWHDL